MPIKSAAQLDVQAIHRVRTQLVRPRTALINQVRGLLRERGIAVAQGPHRLAQALSELQGAPAGISATLRMLLVRRRAAWRQLDAEIGELDRLLVGHARTDARCRRLMTIPGLGPITATALVAAVDDGQAFARARDLAAWLGLVPRQHTTGGRARLRGIAKGGNRYLRTLLVHGARALRRSRHARSAGSAPGSPRSRPAPTAIRSRSRWPTSSPASPGRCSPRRRTTGCCRPDPTCSAGVEAMARTG